MRLTIAFAHDPVIKVGACWGEGPSSKARERRMGLKQQRGRGAPGNTGGSLAGGPASAPVHPPERRCKLQEPLADDTAPAARARPQLQAALLQGLTAEQAHAVTYDSGPLLIVAGPGAGKTRTLIHRIAWLLTCGLARPWEILAVRFSVRAAGELGLRLADLLGEQVAAGGHRGHVPLGMRTDATRGRRALRSH
jgi:hypothetical protein